MLSKRNRIPSQELSDVLRRGTRVRGEYMDFVFKKTSETPRFAVIVSVKIDKRAVIRNRMKRLVREAIQKEIPSLTLTVDGVFLIKKKFPKEYSYEDVSLIVHSMV